MSAEVALQVQRLAPSLADLIAASLWQGLLPVVMTALLMRMLPPLSAAFRSALWAGVLVLTGALPFAYVLTDTARSVQQGAIWHVRPAFSTALIAAWMLAGAARLEQLMLSVLHLRRVLRRAEPVVLAPSVISVLDAGSRRVRVCASSDVDRPSVAGFLHPCILLPTGLLREVSEAELRHILLHEREHLRRGDHWINLLGQISLLLFPLSPALLWLNRRLAWERELACDDRVLAFTGARKAYAASLARVAESSLAQRGLTLAVAMLGTRRRGPDLSRRVERILAPPVRTPRPLQSRFAAGAVCAAILGGVVLLARSPELVSFAPVPGRTVAGERQQAAPLPPTRPAFGAGRVVPVVDRVPGTRRGFRVLVIKAALPVAPHRRTVQSNGGRSAAQGRLLSHRSFPVLIGWHSRAAAQIEPSAAHRWTDPAAASPRVAPVVFRVSSPDPDGAPAWYTAFRTPEGWVVFMI